MARLQEDYHEQRPPQRSHCSNDKPGLESEPKFTVADVSQAVKAAAHSIG